MFVSSKNKFESNYVPQFQDISAHKREKKVFFEELLSVCSI